ncbi:MAG: glycerophosphoryl diester phosphodiesterase membrane domain-containing protein, partial [Planctomycetota bacterium]
MCPTDDGAQGGANSDGRPGLFREVTGSVRRSLKAIVVYEVYFRILIIAVIGPAVSFLALKLVSSSGGPVISNEQIAGFILSPAGAIGLLFVGACVLAIAFAEQAGLLLLVSAADRGRTPRTMNTLVRTLKLLPRFALLGLLQLAIAGIVAVPAVVAVFLIHGAFLSDHDINYYIAARPPEFIAAVASAAVVLIALAAVALTLFARWVFALPLVVFGGLSPRQALRQSGILTRGRKRKILLLLGGWLVVSSAGAAAVMALLRYVSGPLLATATHRVATQLAILGAVLTAHTAVSLIISALTASVVAALVWRLYLRAAPEAKASPLTPDTPSDETPGRWAAVGVWVVIVSVPIVAAAGIWRLSTTMKGAATVAVTAHRGASRDALENTLSAIDLAIEQGADWV